MSLVEEVGLTQLNQSGADFLLHPHNTKCAAIVLVHNHKPKLFLRFRLDLFLFFDVQMFWITVMPE